MRMDLFCFTTELLMQGNQQLLCFMPIPEVVQSLAKVRLIYTGLWV